MEEIFAVLKNHYRGTDFSDAGSSNITSDIDAMVFGPFKEEVKRDFNTSFERFFDQDSSSLLDVNMYDVRMIAVQNDTKHCEKPFSITEVRTKTNAPSFICRLDLRDDPEVVRDQRAWAFAKLLLHASDHEKQLLKLLSSAFPNTLQIDLEKGQAFIKSYKRPSSVIKQNRLYEKASLDLRDLLHKVHEDPKNIDRQRAYLHQGGVCGMYAQDAYFSMGTLADVVFLQQLGIQGYELTFNEYVDSAIENFGDLCKAVHIDYSMLCEDAVVDVSKYLYRTVHALDQVFALELGANMPLKRIEDKSRQVKERVRGKVTTPSGIRVAADDIMKAINIPGKCNINELREKIFLLLFSVIAYIYRP
jgi:hypothetical protein